MRRFMVIEHFRDKNTAQVYGRFQEKGRLLPPGLVYVDSWLAKEGDRCFQLMEAEDEGIFHAWMAEWEDLIDFELIELGRKPHE